MRKLTAKEFIQKSKQVHGETYDYSKSEYKNSSEKLIIICRIHGEFLQSPSNHFSGNGCIRCSHENNGLLFKKSIEQFIVESKELYNNKYDYKKFDYQKAHIKSIIICPKHGEFQRTPNQHLRGCGCPKCKNKSLGELAIQTFLEKHCIPFNVQKRFENCRHKRTLPFDFFLPEHNICIEFDGIGHFQPTTLGKMSKEKAIINFKNSQITDKIKTDFCKNNNIELIRITYLEKEKIKEILCSKLIP